MNYKEIFDRTLVEMKSYISNAKRMYASVKSKGNVDVSDYEEILKYSVVVREYEKYNRETLNDIIMNRLEDECSELQDLYDDFSSEFEDYVDEVVDSVKSEEEEFLSDPNLMYSFLMNQVYERREAEREVKEKEKTEVSKKRLGDFEENSHVRCIGEFVEDEDKDKDE